MTAFGRLPTRVRLKGFGKSEFQGMAMMPDGAQVIVTQVIVTPAGTGMLPARARRRGGSQAPAPMPPGARYAAYRAQNGTRRLTPRQLRRINRMLRRAAELPW